MPNSIENIELGAFYNCNNLKYNEYQNGYYLGNETNKYVVLVKVIDKSADTLIIHKDTKLIYSGALENYSSLKTISIPDGIIKLDKTTFLGCDNLVYNHFKGGCGCYLGNDTNKYLVLMKIQDSSQYQSCRGFRFLVQKSTKFIFADAFKGHNNLKEIRFDNDVKYILEDYYNKTQVLIRENDYTRELDRTETLIPRDKFSVINYLENRDIECLIHFTRVDNLASILQHGILSVKDQGDLGIDTLRNDNIRYDGCLDAISTSIELPNSRLFYVFRRDYPDSKWAVIKLDYRKILSRYECLFCPTNASNSSVSYIPREQRKGVWALSRLFERENNTRFYRLPIDEQAEILVLGNIAVDCIEQIFFENQEIRDKYENLLKRYNENIILSVNPSYFNSNNDWY